MRGEGARRKKISLRAGGARRGKHGTVDAIKNHRFFMFPIVVLIKKLFSDFGEKNNFD
jgi:hypothetical protein